MAVETCSRKIGRPIDDVLKGIGGITVNGRHLRDAVSEYTKKATDDLITEAMRRFPKLEDIFAAIKGLPVPFTTEDISSRLPESIPISHAMEILWESEMIGIEVTCKKTEHIGNFKHLLPSRNYKRDINKASKEFIRWYFFEYNCDGEVTELTEQYKGNEKLDVRLIFHPRIFESISANVSTKWPYGI